MNAKITLFLLVAGIGASFLVSNVTGQKATTPAKPKLAVSIKPQHVADALRAVIVSHREVYAKVTEGQKNVPAPCEMLRQSSEAVASKGVEYAFVLRALQPINKRNAPETAIEIKGLQQVASNPEATFSTEELLGGRWYLTAVYPEAAVSQSCVDCHNAKQEGAGKKHKVGDVLGGLVIRIALEL